MKVKKGNKIKVNYTGTLDDGEVFDSSDHEGHSHPLEFEVGSGQVIKGFDDAVVGMELNEEKIVHIEAKEAYGEKNEKLIMKISRDKLPKDQEPKKGMTLGMRTKEGKEAYARIVDINHDKITLDLNHPLAGKNLNFKLKIISID